MPRRLPAPAVLSALALALVVVALAAPRRARADAIVVVRAMTATTIAEVFVEADSIRVDLEIGVDDLEAFANILPGDLLARMGREDAAPIAERLERFWREDLVIRLDDGPPLVGRVTGIEGRPRIRRDDITGEPLPETGEEETVLAVELRYEPPARPASLSITPPGVQATGRPVANVGFVVYHRGLAVNDFRYLGQTETVDLDWDDPWYSSFRNRNLRRQFHAPLSGYLYVDAFEVRQEIVVRPSDLEHWIDLGLDGRETIPAAEQGAILGRVAEFLRGRNPVTVDGVPVAPVLDRVHFIRRSLRQTAVMDASEDVPVIPAMIGAIFVHPVTALPREVTMRWEMFTPRIDRVPVVATDEAGGLPSMVDPDDPVLTWTNFLKSPSSRELVAVAAPPAPRRWRVPVVSAALLWPVARVSVPSPLGRAPDVSAADGPLISGALLRNVYRAFDHREESDIYDVLAHSTDGELLTEVYLETKRALELRNQGGARVRVNDVEMLETGVTNLDGETGFVLDGAWIVSGSVGHWGHVHVRRNRYDAELTVKPVDGAWKITDLRLLDEQRLPGSTPG